jgi:hypothetical protein
MVGMFGKAYFVGRVRDQKLDVGRFIEGRLVRIRPGKR